jgi:hypothetical protein
MSGLLGRGGPIVAETGGVISMISDCENVVEVVDEGRIGICRGPRKLGSAGNGLRGIASAVRLIVTDFAQASLLFE